MAGDAHASGPDGDPLVWHYTNGPGLISILRSHTLWATSAAFLNDRHEVQLGGRLMAARAAERATGERRRDLQQRLQRLTEDTFGPAASRFYILSASRLWDSLAMWRLYGGAEESYAVGLAMTEPLAVLGGSERQADGPVPGLFLQRHSWAPVRYAHGEQVELVDGVLDAAEARFEELRALGVGPDELPDERGEEQGAVRSRIEQLDPRIPAKMAELVEELQQALLLIKHPGFIDERETRYSLIMQTHPEFSEARAAEDSALCYRATGYGIAPYLRLTGAGPDLDGLSPIARPLPVRAVAISPSPNGAVASDSVRRLLAASGYGELPVLRSEIPFRG